MIQQIFLQVIFHATKKWQCGEAQAEEQGGFLHCSSVTRATPC
jgi:hypothetical protein